MAGVHATFTVQAEQVPLSQTSLVPHVVPLVIWVVVGLHTGAPVVHEIVPVTHGLVGVHDAPVVQALQVPLSQTSFVPQTVPLAALLPVSVHTGAPVVQTMVPVWQALVGVHAAPIEHVVHEPFSQTSPVPHEVPLATFPVTPHTDVPVAQEVSPVWQTLPVEHDTPAVHDAHVPLSQTSLVPHEVPLFTGLPVSLQTGNPVVHDVVPVWQLLAGVHAVPVEHAPHAPLSQTIPVPHDVPFGRELPESLHTDTPVEHDVEPV